MKYIYTIITIILPLWVMGQQLPKASSFDETSFHWNPAMTGLWDYWELTAGYRQQWVGFEDAPRTALLGFQLPFPDNNMSIGASIIHDRTHPMNFNAITLMYAYKIRTGLFYKDQLSLGIMASLSEYRLDLLEVQVNDYDDNLLLGDASSSMKPNAGVGFHYTTYGGSDFEQSYFFIGAAVNQFFPMDLTFNNGSDGNLKRAIHGNGVIGFRAVNGNVAIQPSVWINYADAGVANMNLALKLEREDSFWTGFAYSSDRTFGLQAGAILKNGFLKDGTLRVGMMGSYNLGGFGKYDSLGYEFYLAYRFEL